MPLAGRPMVEWSIEAFRAAASVRSIVVACPPGHDYESAGEAARLDAARRRTDRRRRRRDPRRVGRQCARGGRDRAGRDPRRGPAAAHAGAGRGRRRDPDADPAPPARSPPRPSPTRSSGAPRDAVTRRSRGVIDVETRWIGSSSGRRRRRRCSAPRRCAGRWRPIRSEVAAATDEAMLVEAAGGGS